MNLREFFEQELKGAQDQLAWMEEHQVRTWRREGNSPQVDTTEAEKAEYRRRIDEFTKLIEAYDKKTPAV